ncbi:SHOCT domain-containing protein [Streptomyces sp. NBC_01571]|uniref:SHOCT domain-containing protein n=1 Tax=Streptomyces sp. NBC_01571 TaxID=2975883 RepID=UPI002255B362|nr:SHOCT domain-containing protein [Streptomyces sp. NBC_01571]MCX4578743.1 SHOCT domain-containing protein [Streptomyces sp. NBC_01571]
MPGLLRGVARTAAVAGTATAVSNRVARRQHGRWARQAAPEPTPASSPSPFPVATPPLSPSAPLTDDMNDKIDQLKRLGELKAQGLLTEAEFTDQKHRILSD